MTGIGAVFSVDFPAAAESLRWKQPDIDQLRIEEMIKILFKDTLSCPVFNCDVCGDMIGDLSEGAAVFADLPRRKENLKIDVLHVHKGKCHELAEQRTKSKCEWQPLGAHLYFLCANTEVDGTHLDKLKRLHGTRTT